MNNEVSIILKGKEAKIWAIMKALETLNAFDIKYGRVTIDFDGQSKISNVKVEKNYKLETIEELN